MITAQFLGCMIFPTLFPYRKGDWFNQEYRVGVKLAEYNKHMFKYSVNNSNLENDALASDYVYPFAGHDIWVYLIQNIGDRHRLNDQHNVYLQKNMEDAN